jgi:17beta-estradiol 17-dehydrogenase / very-long-chain 3-oxoacyl-CoA reductase
MLKPIVLALGTIKLMLILAEVLRFLIEHASPSFRELKRIYPAKDKTKRPWALITGSSDGMGAEYARQIAAGFNIVLVSRDKNKLSAVSADIKDANP